ncbi:type IV conjugative transfer system pilin TraA [Escherichia coli]|uniref:type IV conjugative transfer system pilin TraA n=1 Tax=Escherichia coli TaxID=562 RepID=UPI00351CEE1A
MKKGKTLEPGLLASDSDWHNNACLNYMPDHGTAYTEGYRRAADILINHIDESGRDQDFLVYPVLFLYRHHLELLIKQIIGLALALAEDPDKDSSVVKWVVLAEVLVGAVMYMITKNVKFLAGFAIISVFIAVGMAVVGLK